MSNLTKDTIFATRSRKGIAIQAKNAVQFYAGSLTGIDTNASGRAARWADTAAFKFLGIANRQVLGNTSASPVPEVEVDMSGPILENVPVTGVTAVTDQGAKVYATSDNPGADLTLTPTTNVKAIGVIVRWRTSTRCDVKLFTPEEYDTQALASDITQLTDNSGGGAADGTIGVVTAPTALTHAVGTADGTVDDVGGAFNQTTLNNNFKELTTAAGQERTAIVALTDAVKELSTKLNAVIAALNLA